MKKYFLALSLVNVLAADTLLDTQVISDSGFSTSLSDVSSNLYVINKEDISKKNYKNVGEILSFLPGISINPIGVGSAIDIRGQGENANARVKFLVDGISQNSIDTSHLGVPYNTISVNDIEQIEVIPGGGTVVYGNGTAGGVVNIITKASLKKDYANFMLGVGSFNHKSVGAGAGANITDRLYTHFGINYVDEKGYQRSNINKLLNTDLGFKIALSDTQSLDLNGSYMQQKDRSNDVSEKLLEQDRRYEGTVCLQYLGFMCAPGKTVLLGQSEPKQNTRKSFDIKYNNEINENINANAMAYLRESNYEDKSLIDKLKGVNAKAKFAYDNSTTVLGYGFEQANSLRHAAPTETKARKDSHSIFALEQLDFNPFSIDIGARYENSKYKIFRTDGKESVDDNKKMNNFGANIVLAHKFADTNTVFFKFERGFTSPSSYNFTDKEDGVHYTLNNLKSENYLNYELGFKGLVFDQFASLSIFYTQTNNEIQVNMSHRPTVKWTYENVSKTRRYGAELSMQQSFLDDTLNIFENLSYVNAKVVNDEIKTYKSGQKIPNVSPFQASIGANYKLTDKLSVGADYRYYSKTNWDYTVGGIEVPKKAYSLVDANIAYEFNKNISAVLEAKNIFGTKYDLNCSGGKCRVAPTNSYYLQLRAKF